MKRETLDIGLWQGLQVLSPHSDDAGFSCAGLLAHVARQQMPCLIQTIFSRSNYDPSDPQADADVVTALRMREDDTFVTWLGGGCQVSWEGFEEAYMRKAGFAEILSGQYDDGDQALMPPLLQAVMAKMADRVILLAPVGIGNHVDHLLVRDAALALSRHTGVELYLYEDLPYAARLLPNEVADYLAPMGNALGFRPCPYVFSTPDIQAAKQAGAACYPSQMQGDTGALIEKQTAEIGGEAYWRIEWQAA
ncbi:PIG-L deacetylase family protein [Aestuariispira insulae]|uniref:LmbE family N-acetylglucosaminyl deacetylase n=1 Tax=Aestuariispira insulae TaxID=1461337 RepID=A0A3D9HER6_9PROT|nr:PIG-L family deacetylase [Aestuariispira insulae]RED47741.1 LmbE family N-acetylglucosaminyl deacetylase [Aestuariispira insulae]